MRIAAETTTGDVMEFQYPYMLVGDRLPKVGEICHITYHVAAVRGVSGAESVELEAANIIDAAACSKNRSEHSPPSDGVN